MVCLQISAQNKPTLPLTRLPRAETHLGCGARAEWAAAFLSDPNFLFEVLCKIRGRQRTPPARTQVAELSWRNGRNPLCKFSSERWSETSNGLSDSRNLSTSTLRYLVLQLGNRGLGGQSRRRRRGLRSFNYIEGKRRRRGLRVKQRCGEATASLPPHRNRKADKVLAHMPNMMRSRRRLFSFI